MSRKSGAASLAISSPQRRRPTSMKEHKTYITLERPLRRAQKSSRITDRWPMLNRIIRGNKSIVSATQIPYVDGTDTSEEEKEEEGLVILHTTKTLKRTQTHKYQIRKVHPTSPAYPSPLSGVKPIRRLPVARHNYINCGYSQSALFHQRELWKKRKSEWEEYEYLLWQAGVTHEEAYGGMSGDDPSRSLPPLLANALLKTKDCTNSEAFRLTKPLVEESVSINPATVPRLGDLSSIKNSFLASVDTWFCDVPLWTLHKLIWIHDVNHRVKLNPISDVWSNIRNKCCEEPNPSNCSSETLLSSFTDCSGSTMINTSPCEYQKHTINHPTTCEETGMKGRSTLAILKKNTELWPWEKCWEARWEILCHQMHCAENLLEISQDLDPYPTSPKKVIQLILTTSYNLYDPYTYNNATLSGCDEESHVKDRTDQEDWTSCYDNDDEYGAVKSEPESRSRFGAHVDPASMFATATEAQITLYTTPHKPFSRQPSCIKKSCFQEDIDELTNSTHHLVVS